MFKVVNSNKNPRSTILFKETKTKKNAIFHFMRSLIRMRTRCSCYSKNKLNLLNLSDNKIEKKSLTK